MTKNEDLIQILNQIGLSENEGRVYLASLQLGPSKIAKISRVSEVKRTTVYPIVESLIRKGLIREKIEGLKSVFIAENPDRLENILEERNKQLKEVFPQFKALYSLEGNESVIKYYDTNEGLKNVYRELLAELQTNNNYYVIGDPERYDTSNEKFFKDFIQKRIKIKLNAKVLLTPSKLANEYKKFEKNFGEEVKIMPEGASTDVNVVITENKLIIHQIIEPRITMVIENQSIVKMQQMLFEMVWRMII